jgi:hypothetical protein
MGFIQLAKGASHWFAITETAFVTLQLSFTVVLLRWFGLWGAALAFAVAYGLYIPGMLYVAARLTGFRWSGEVVRLLFWAAALVMAGLAVRHSLPNLASLGAGVCLTGLAAVVSLRGAAQRLGAQHRVVKLLMRLPGGGVVCGLECLRGGPR